METDKLPGIRHDKQRDRAGAAFAQRIACEQRDRAMLRFRVHAVWRSRIA